MSPIRLILALGASLFALRLLGLVLPRQATPAAWDRALAFVPITLLTALVVASLGARSDHVGHRLVAAAVAALVAYRTQQVWACIVGGLLVYWLLALL